MTQLHNLAVDRESQHTADEVPKHHIKFKAVGE